MLRVLFLSMLFSLGLLASGTATANDLLNDKTFGGGFGVQVEPSRIRAEDLAEIKSLGFGFVRFSVYWNEIEQEDGSYDWSHVDALIEKVRAAGLRMIVPVHGAHPLYGGWVPAPEKNVDHVRERIRAPSLRDAQKAFAKFMAALVHRYGTKDVVWEIWNEPDTRRFWPSAPDARAYSRLAQRACRAVKRVEPTAVIVGPALARVPDPRDGVTTDYLETFLSSPAARCVDAISVHPYRHGNERPEETSVDYQTMFAALMKYRLPAPLINSEWGYATTQASQDEQAAYILRTRLGDMMWGLPLTIWYEWQDSVTDPQDIEGNFGLRTAQGADKESMRVIKDFLPLLKDAKFERRLFVEDPDLFLFQMRQPDGQNIIVGWDAWTDREESPDLRMGEGEDLALTSMPQVLYEGADLPVFSLRP